MGKKQEQQKSDIISAVEFVSKLNDLKMQTQFRKSTGLNNQEIGEIIEQTLPPNTKKFKQITSAAKKMGWKPTENTGKMG